MRTFIFFLIVFSINTLNAQTTVSGGFNHNGLDREYRLYIPSSYQQGIPVPLVINLHGYGSNNIEQELYSQMGLVADTAGFLLVHPNGTPDITGTNHWNTFGTSTVDDVSFLSDLIDTIASNYDVDLQRVYSTGMSNGGFMSFSLACQLGNRIAAIASVTGTMTNFNFNACFPERAVPVLQIHGTADGTVPYEGNFLFVPVQSLIDFWVINNQTSTDPIIELLPDIEPADGSTAERFLYGNGINGSSVEHFKIIDGGHSWPGAPINLNVTNMDFSASAEIWRFFKQYNLQGVISSMIPQEKSGILAHAYPNPAKGSINISLPSDEMHQITVYDLYGRLISSFDHVGSRLDLKLESLGLYLIHIRNGQNTQVIRVLNASIN